MAYSPSEAYSTGTRRWALNYTEVAFNLEKDPSIKGLTEEQKWKVNCPKIMPLIPIEPWREDDDNLDDSLFINDPSCKPQVTKKIKIRNFMIVTHLLNRPFIYKYKPHKMKVEIDLPYGNMDNPHITDRIDNSEPDP